MSELRAALAAIAKPGCEASRWHGEEPPVDDRCLDYEYVEEEPTGDPDVDRCAPCRARAALRSVPDDGLRDAAKRAFAADGIAAAQRVWPEGVALVSALAVAESEREFDAVLNDARLARSIDQEATP